jgi:hypothetical protein
MKAGWFENERKQWDRIEAAANEAERFLDRVAALRAAATINVALPPPENAAMKRSSLDLSRALALVRKERWYRA